MSQIRKTINQIWNKLQTKYYFVILGIYLLAYSALLRANEPYVDDYGRTFQGYHGWTDYSRWTTEILATLVHANWRLSDISPLPQIMACVLAAAASTIMMRVFVEEKINPIHAIAASLLGLTPYYLGVISYKFDAPYMTVALLAGVIPFTVDYWESKTTYAVLTFVCAIIMCTTYQSFSGVYPTIAFFIFMRGLMEYNGSDGKIAFRRYSDFLLISAISYLAGLATFALLLMRGNPAETVPVLNIPALAVRKYLRYYRQIYVDQSLFWTMLDVVVVVLFVIVLIRRSKRPIILSYILAIATALIESAMCFGALLVISDEALDMRCMVGFCVFVTVCALHVCANDRFLIGNIAVISLAWCYMTVALTVGNAMSQQQAYLRYRISILGNALASLEVMQTDATKYVYIEGALDHAPAVEQLVSSYPIVERAIFTGLGAGYWGGYYLMHYFDFPNLQTGADEIGDRRDYDIVVDDVYETIAVKDQNIIVTVK